MKKVIFLYFIYITLTLNILLAKSNDFKTDIILKNSAPLDNIIHYNQFQENLDRFRSNNTINPPNISFIDSIIVVLEYKSVYDVHVSPDTIKYPNIRIQPGGFDEIRILNDLETIIDPFNYDFVLFYTLHEVPGWINSGPTTSTPAKNIGLYNNFKGRYSWVPKSWTKLRSVPHMNSIDFLDRSSGLPNFGSTLTAIHEIDHYWGVYITVQDSVGPRNWIPGVHPVAWLASGWGHWSWVWESGGMPGIMYSAALSNKFNEFDLYFMGLMGYNEASKAVYKVYEYPRTNPPTLHDVNLDSLIYALSLAGNNYYKDDGRRIPDVDSSVQNLRILIAVVKGQDEEFTEEQRKKIVKLAKDLPGDWEVATWNRSSMSVGIDIKNTTAVQFNTQVPLRFELNQNYPNPFNPKTKIEYKIPRIARVTLKIYNILGQEIKTIVDNELQPGSYQIIWDGTNNYNVHVSSGIYIYQIRAGNFVQTKKMIFLR